MVILPFEICVVTSFRMAVPSRISDSDLALIMAISDIKCSLFEIMPQELAGNIDQQGN